MLVTILVKNPDCKHIAKGILQILTPHSHCAIKEGERMKKFPEKHDARESDYDNK